MSSKENDIFKVNVNYMTYQKRNEPGQFYVFMLILD